MNGELKHLLNFNKKLTPIEIGGKTYYVKNQTIGEVTAFNNIRHARLLELAKEQNIIIDETADPAEIEEQLAKVNDEYTFAMLIGSRLCNAEGELFFDISNKKDLDKITTIDGSIIHALNSTITNLYPKS